MKGTMFRNYEFISDAMTFKYWKRFPSPYGAKV